MQSFSIALEFRIIFLLATICSSSTLAKAGVISDFYLMKHDIALGDEVNVNDRVNYPTSVSQFLVLENRQPASTINRSFGGAVGEGFENQNRILSYASSGVYAKEGRSGIRVRTSLDLFAGVSSKVDVSSSLLRWVAAIKRSRLGLNPGVLINGDGLTFGSSSSMTAAAKGETFSVDGVFRIGTQAYSLSVAVRDWTQNPDGSFEAIGNERDDSSSQAILVYSLGELPGLSKESAIAPNKSKAYAIDPNYPQDLFDSSYLTPSIFSTPVASGYGMGSDTLYFDPLLASGYRYAVEGSRFSTFVVPDALPNGDQQFELLWNDVRYALRAGQVFDFRSIDPMGARYFDLEGLSLEIDNAASHAKFVSGFTFTDEGLATVYQAAHVSAVPEPSSILVFAVGGMITFARFRRLKSIRA